MMTPKTRHEVGMDGSLINRRSVLRSTLAVAGAGAVASGTENRAGAQPSPKRVIRASRRPGPTA